VPDIPWIRHTEKRLLSKPKHKGRDITIHHKEMVCENAVGYISLNFDLERTKKFGIHKKAGYFLRR
jgi:hypothetical protein